ncbi:peptidoglycan-binding protein [Streptomyces piniterrae]|uniref:Peptidoglycan-binding protein n=1 Tax=Streptomyces piniterrae TaxID=2571125 RepID=A0A4U0NJ85_9ACTN|nr:peptidoglycan-binding protein [Streptomyces piniterrae]
MLSRRRIAVAAATVLAGVLLTAAPAGAHSATPTAVPASPTVKDAAAYCGYYDGNATTGRGDRGDRVREVQCLINLWNGGTPLQVDGDFGPRTESWVVYFQDVNGLGVDGIVGPETWNALRGV